MDGEEPTEEALGELNDALRAHIETRYPVSHLEIMEDGLTSYLIGARDEDE